MWLKGRKTVHCLVHQAIIVAKPIHSADPIMATLLTVSVKVMPSLWQCASVVQCLSAGVFLRCSFSNHHLSFLQEQEFLQKQQQELDSALKKIIQQHKHELATTERDCLNHKQQLLRGNKV